MVYEYRRERDEETGARKLGIIRHGSAANAQCLCVDVCVEITL